MQLQEAVLGQQRLSVPQGQSREASVRRARIASHKRATSSNTLLTSGLTRGMGEGDAGAGGDAEAARHVGPSGAVRQDLQSRRGSRSTSSKMRGCVTSYASERPVAFPSPERDCSLRMGRKCEASENRMREDTACKWQRIESHAVVWRLRPQLRQSCVWRVT